MREKETTGVLECASGASSLSAERRIENQPPREAGAWQNSCEQGLKFFADGGGRVAGRAELGPSFVSDFAGNKDASLSREVHAAVREGKCS